MSSVNRPELGTDAIPQVSMAKPLVGVGPVWRERTYSKMIMEEFAKAGVRPALGLAIARHESVFSPKAMNNTGMDARRGGSFGLCQVSLQTARALGFTDDFEKLLNPRVNAYYAAKLCAQNQLRVPVATVRDENNIRWAFNMAALYNSGVLWADCPRSTRQIYCPKVVSYFLLYQHLLDMVQHLRG